MRDIINLYIKVDIIRALIISNHIIDAMIINASICLLFIILNRLTLTVYQGKGAENGRK
jgi:hypothetical protein